MILNRLENENEESYLWRLGQAKDSGLVDYSWNDIADIMNKEFRDDISEYRTETAYRKPYSQAKRFYYAGAFDQKPVVAPKTDTIEDLKVAFGAETSINKDGSYSSKRLIEMSEVQSKDPKYILKAHGFEPNDWEIVSVRNTIRQAISRQNEDGVATLYASYITVKPKKENDLSLDKIEKFFNNLDRNYSLPEIKRTNEYLEGDKLLLIDIADLHHNLQATMFTSMNEYNCQIAEKLFFYVINDVLSRTANYDFDKIVFVIGGDLITSDTLSGTTTKGTPQDNDLHYYEACERLYAMTIMAIDMLKEIAPVDVILCVGNHDEVTCYKLAKYIDAWFRNENRVKVDYTPLARKYFLYGKTLMCFAHDGKVNKLPALIADEARQLWSQAETVEVFLQHLHTEQVLMEDNNIRIQRLPTISARSKWCVDKGYSSKRQCKSFIFDKEDGLTDVIYTPIRV